MKNHSLFRFLFMVLVMTLVTAPISHAAKTSSSTTDLMVIEVTERMYKGGPALAVILSDKLDPKKNHDKYFTVTTKKEKVESAWVLDENQQVLYLPNVLPDTRYTILVKRGLTAANGRKTRAHVEKKVKTKPIVPSYGFASTGSVLPEKLASGIPVMTVNVDAVDIEFLKVKDDKMSKFMSMAGFKSSTEWYALDNFHKLVDSVYTARFNTSDAPNKRVVTNIPVKAIKQLRAPGLYIAVMKAPGRFAYKYQTSYFFVTDIGLHIRNYNNKMVIVASSLASAKALVDVKIDLFDKKGKTLKTAWTDEDGRATFEGLDGKTRLVTAGKGNHVSFVSLRRFALDLSEFDTSGRAYQDPDLFLYGPRDLYRPGESVTISGLLRTGDGRPVAAALPIKVRIRQATGRVVSQFTWKSDALGYYEHTFAIPHDAPTGTWHFEAKTDPASKSHSHEYAFKVEAFLPERMKIDFETDQDFLKPKEKFNVTLKGAYLYGAPASGNRIRVVSHTGPSVHPIQKRKEFYFGNPDDKVDGGRVGLFDGDLGKDGIYPLSFLPFSTPPTSPAFVRISAELFETGGRPVIRSIRRNLLPAEGVVGIRPLFDGDYADNNSQVGFEIIKSDKKGNLLKAGNLQVSLVHEDREYFWEYSESDGWRWNYTQSAYPVFRQDISIESGKKQKVLVPVKYGRYYLEINDPETGLVTRHRFYAGWSWGQDGKDSARPDAVTLSFDKKAYRPGDTAILSVKPPHAGDLVVMAEADAPLWFARMPVSEKGADVKIPISKLWQRHDIFVTALVIRPADKKKRITPERAFGLIHLALDRKDRKLEPRILSPDKTEPEKTMRVSVQLKDFSNEKTRVTLAAVDVGVLNITDFATPDPFEWFFSKKRYTVDAYDLYGQVIESMEGKKATVRFGGDADTSGFMAGKKAKAKVKIVSWFSGPVDVDENGIAKIDFHIPDFNGTLKLMAVAFDKNRFGAAEKEVIVRAPVIAELSTPRFLASNDRSFATLDLTNLSGVHQDLSVSLDASKPLVIEKKNARAALKDGSKTTLVFPMTAMPDLGVGRIHVRVKGKGVDIKRTWEIAVRPAFPGDYRVRKKVLKKGEAFNLEKTFADGLMESSTDMHFHLSTVPPLDVKDAVKNLLQYPYGCLEQTVSRAFPLLFVNENVAKRFSITPISDTERQKRIEKAFARISGMQKSNGGFGVWSSHSPEAMWLTPYAAHLMLEAKEQGFSVPQTLMKKTFDRLYKMLQRPGGFSANVTMRSKDLVFAARAYAAYVLARVNRAPLGTLRNLYDNHGKKIKSGLPFVHLGIALGLKGDKDRSARSIKNGLGIEREKYLWFGDYGSPVRDTAMILYLLGKHKIHMPGKGELYGKLDNHLSGRRWFSTQERNAVFLAGLMAAEKAKPLKGLLTVGTSRISIAGKVRFKNVFGVDDVKKGMRFVSDADADVYVTVRVSGYPVKPPEKVEDMGIYIKRNLYDLDGVPVGDRPLTVGEMLVAHLSVEVEDPIYDGLVVDLLPAGLELENQNMAHSEKLSDLVIDKVNMKKAMADRRIVHTQYRDDRFVAALHLDPIGPANLFYLVRVVSPGVFGVPAPYAEDMYRPEIRGIGSGQKQIRIENKIK